MARRLAVGVAVTLVALLGIGFLLPEPFGLAADTVVNQPLAEAQAAETARQAEIERLLALIAAEPTDTALLSDLADAYLAGPAAEDLQRAASVLLLLIGLDPDDPDPYARLISAYIRASDWTNAAAATDALAELAPSSPDVPFFRGLIAWRGYGDAATALDAFDAFLEIAPDDPRVPMIRALRQQAASSTEEVP
jgi:tetratricopeptide (TPR) repeat protein